MHQTMQGARNISEEAAARKYHVFSRTKSGKYSQLTGYPMPHAQCMTFISKMTHPATCLVVEDNDMERFMSKNPIYAGWGA